MAKKRKIFPAKEGSRKKIRLAPPLVITKDLRQLMKDKKFDLAVPYMSCTPGKDLHSTILDLRDEGWLKYRGWEDFDTNEMYMPFDPNDPLGLGTPDTYTLDPLTANAVHSLCHLMLLSEDCEVKNYSLMATNDFQKSVSPSLAGVVTVCYAEGVFYVTAVTGIQRYNQMLD